MKTRIVHQNQSSNIFSKHKRMFDVTAKHRGFPLRSSFRSVRKKAIPSPVLSRKRGFDGIYTGNHTFLKQLENRSFKDVLWFFLRKTEMYFRFAKRTVIRFTPDIAPHKMLYGSLVGGVAFGIISMGFIEHFFGPGVFVRASDSETIVATTVNVATVPDTTSTSAEGTTGNIVDNSGYDSFFEYFNEAEDEKYKENIREMVKGYPIEAMLLYIFEQDRLTASFLIGIAKKESNWGIRVPVDEQGNDCFNYWGYRGIRDSMGTGGHTCFNDRQDAVATVAKRINTLIHSNELDTPEKMIIWKCGFSCTGHSAESVRKWIADVAMYFDQAGGGW